MIDPAANRISPEELRRLAANILADDIAVTPYEEMAAVRLHQAADEIERLNRFISDYTESISSELNKLRAVADAAEKLGCSCEFGIGRPGLTNHSPQCRGLLDALKAWRGERPTGEMGEEGGACDK